MRVITAEKKRMIGSTKKAGMPFQCGIFDIEAKTRACLLGGEEEGGHADRDDMPEDLV